MGRKKKARRPRATARTPSLRTITLTASRVEGQSATIFCARIRGIVANAFDYEIFKLHSAGAGQAEIQVVVDEPGLYVERSVHEANRIEDLYWVAWRDGNVLRADSLEYVDAMLLARRIKQGTSNFEFAGLACRIAFLEQQQSESLQKDPDKKVRLSVETASLFGWDRSRRYTRLDVLIRRALVRARLLGRLEALDPFEPESPAQSFGGFRGTNSARTHP